MNFLKIKELDSNNYMPVFVRDNICIDHGDGNKLYDINGNVYVDFVAGIATNILGYNHPRLTKTIGEQAAKLIHVSNHYYMQEQAEYCQNLLEAAGYDRVFLCNSGAEANECALKLARRCFVNSGQSNRLILTSDGSFHGRTLATLTMTSKSPQHALYAPLPEGFKQFKHNDFESFKENLDGVGAVMLETIQGESGVRPFSYDFLVNAYALCKSKGILFILDEVQTGFGRTGTLFSYMDYGISPDIVTLAKGIAGGIPMGACMARQDAATAFHIGDHGSTFGGNALACACANVVLDELLNNGLLEKAKMAGERLGNGLAPFAKYNFIKQIRGKGLMRGIELTPELPNVQVAGKLATRGYLVNCAGNNTIRLVPPLTIEDKEIDGLCKAMSDVFSSTNI